MPPPRNRAGEWTISRLDFVSSAVKHSVRLPGLPSGDSPVNSHLAILHEDADCLAVIKPAGQFPLGTWAPPGELTFEEAVRRHLDPDRPESVYLGIVHRLDRPTSGVLIWAKTPRAARRLSVQFERRSALKEYWALVESAASGGSESAEGDDPTWCDWLTRPGRTGLVRIVPPETPGARSAITRASRGEAGRLPAGVAWLRLRPETGRTHQLRVQAAARGHPILGDLEYGSKTAFEPPHAIALHARSLRVRHPTLQTPMTLVAPIPPAWRRLGFDPGEVD
jgi:23S rRNA pseudouridine1911/1915/1917 synthase